MLVRSPAVRTWVWLVAPLLMVRVSPTWAPAGRPMRTASVVALPCSAPLIRASSLASVVMVTVGAAVAVVSMLPGSVALPGTPETL